MSQHIQQRPVLTLKGKLTPEELARRAAAIGLVVKPPPPVQARQPVPPVPAKKPAPPVQNVKKVKQAPPPPKYTPEEQAARRVANIQKSKQRDEANQQAAAQLRLERNRVLMVRVQEMWPELFNPEAPRPLAVGVAPAFRLALGIGWKPQKSFLAWWTHRPEYLRAIIAGGMRFGLDGAPGDEITAEQQAHAAKMLASRSVPSTTTVAEGEAA